MVSWCGMCVWCGVVYSLVRQRLQCKRMLSVGTRKSAVEKELNSKQAMGSRDALAKSIYEKLFSWLVSMVNNSLAVSKPGTGMWRMCGGCVLLALCVFVCPGVSVCVRFS